MDNVSASPASVGPLRRRAWSPYIVGAGIGVLSWVVFLTAQHPLGITTAFEYTAALTEKAAAPDLAARNSYFERQASEGKRPKIDWEWMLVIGVFVGAFISSKLGRDRNRENIPRLWAQRFGSGAAKRYLWAFAGGAVMIFGARLAQGCTSGHGISGALQFAVSSWVFMPLAFAVAVAVAFALYGRKGGFHV